MATVYINVYLVPGEPQQAWCDRCLTSAAVTIPVHALMPSGPICVGAVTTCLDCDGDDDPEALARHIRTEVEDAIADMNGR
jgi:hypothetical protein